MGQQTEKTTEEIDELVKDEPKTDKPETKKAESAEEKAVEQIEEQDKADALDELYDKESNPEEPMLVVGEEKHKFLARLKRPMFWFKVFLLLIVIFIFAWLITPSRLLLLNTVGLRSNFDVTTTVAVDKGTPPMLKNATVTINGKAYHTDDNGKLHLKLPFGFLHVVVTKQGYETITKDETLDFDPFFDKLGGAAADQAMRAPTFAMKSVGIAINFTARDWLTGQPITSGQFSVGDVAAQPDPQGIVSLTIPATDAKTVRLSAKFDATYQNVTKDVTIQTGTQDIFFAPAGKDYFISKRDGGYAVYGINLDGSGLNVLVPSSPHETGAVTFSASPSGKYGILASTRDATHDGFGSLQQKLYVVDTSTGKLTPMDSGLQFTIIDWQGDTVVYQVSTHNTNGVTVTRLASLNIVSGAQTNLATVNALNVARVALANVVYLTDTGELHIVPVKGGVDKSLGTGVTKLTQPDAVSVAYLSGSTWAQYNINTSQTSTIPVPASTTRAFVNGTSSDGQSNLIADTIDGKLTLIAKAVSGGQETKLYTGNDMTGPIHWIGSVAVYRVGASDYAVSPSGGAPKKITDVSPSQTQANDYFALN